MAFPLDCPLDLFYDCPMIFRRFPAMFLRFPERVLLFAIGLSIGFSYVCLMMFRRFLVMFPKVSYEFPMALPLDCPLNFPMIIL